MWHISVLRQHWTQTENHSAGGEFHLTQRWDTFFTYWLYGCMCSYLVYVLCPRMRTRIEDCFLCWILYCHLVFNMYNYPTHSHLYIHRLAHTHRNPSVPIYPCLFPLIQPGLCPTIHQGIFQSPLMEGQTGHRQTKPHHHLYLCAVEAHKTPARKQTSLSLRGEVKSSFLQFCWDERGDCDCESVCLCLGGREGMHLNLHSQNPENKSLLDLTATASFSVATRTSKPRGISRLYTDTQTRDLIVFALTLGCWKHTGV